jgi:hypothetical protein
LGKVTETNSLVDLISNIQNEHKKIKDYFDKMEKSIVSSDFILLKSTMLRVIAIF